MKNIFCDGAKDAIVIQGLPEMLIKEIEIENCVMKSERGISIYDAEEIKIRNTKVIANDPVVKINQSKNVLFNNFSVRDANKVVFQVNGIKSNNILVKGNSSSALKNLTKLGSEVSVDAIKFE